MLDRPKATSARTDVQCPIRHLHATSNEPRCRNCLSLQTSIIICLLWTSVRQTDCHNSGCMAWLVSDSDISRYRYCLSVVATAPLYRHWQLRLHLTVPPANRNRNAVSNLPTIPHLRLAFSQAGVYHSNSHFLPSFVFFLFSILLSHAGTPFNVQGEATVK